MQRKTFAACALGGAALLGACAPTPEVSARQDFQTYCAGCHGADARGAGPDAVGLPVTPPDLTLIAARHGGAFPRQEVMAQIDGYTRRDEAMPDFGAVMMQGELVPVDFGDGRPTPTPVRLLALADYLETLQRPSP